VIASTYDNGGSYLAAGRGAERPDHHGAAHGSRMGHRVHQNRYAGVRVADEVDLIGLEVPADHLEIVDVVEDAAT
jgi:hypothetical protein